MEWHLSEGKGNSINICVAGTLISSFHQPFIHSLRWWGPVPIVQLWRAPSSSDKKCEETAAFRTLYYPRTVNPSSSSWNWSTNAECWSLARNKKYLDMYPQRLNQLPSCMPLFTWVRKGDIEWVEEMIIQRLLVVSHHEHSFEFSIMFIHLSSLWVVAAAPAATPLHGSWLDNDLVLRND